MICVMIRSECSTSSWMMLDLLGRDGSALFERPLERERRVVDNGQRILHLMRELRRDTPGGAELAFPHGELASLLHCPPLPLQQHLHPVAADGHQQEQRQAERQRLGKNVRRSVGAQSLPGEFIRIVRRRNAQGPPRLWRPRSVWRYRRRGWPGRLDRRMPHDEGPAWFAALNLSSSSSARTT